MKNLPLILIIAFLSGSIQLLAGGGWPQPKGSGYFKLGQWWVLADGHYTDQGVIDPNSTIGIFNTSFYGEYGFTDRLTGIVYFPFFSRSLVYNTVSRTTNEVLVPGEAINSLGDTDIGIKYGIIANKPVVVSASLFLGLPLGEDKGGSAGVLQTGDGEFNQMLQIDAGTGFSLGKFNAYANAYLGFNNRTNGFADEIRYGLEAGISLPKPRLGLTLRLYGVNALDNSTLDEVPNSTSIFANGSEHFSFSPELYFQFNDKWGVSVATATAFSGRLILADPSYAVGVFFKL